MVFQTKAARERWSVRFVLSAVAISAGALFLTYFQLKSPNRAVEVEDAARKDANKGSSDALALAEHAREDALTEAERQRADEQTTLERQQKEAAAGLEAQTKRADRANELADRSTKAAEDTAKTAAL